MDAQEFDLGLLTDGGRLFPVSYQSEDVNEREGVVTYWLPFVNQNGEWTFLDTQSWAFREIEASDLAVRTTWRYPDGTVWIGPLAPAGAANTGERRP